MDLTLRSEYWNDLKARNAFKDFLIKIHGLDLSEWESLGYWDEAYTPFSLFQGEEIVSSVCIYSLDASIRQKETKIAQISGVGTLPEWRRKGLNRQLTEAGLKWAQNDHKGVFLFSDEMAIPFYSACGFEPIEEYVEFTGVKAAKRKAGAVKLNPDNKKDLERIYQFAKDRAPISKKLSVLNPKLLMFHALYTLRDHLYEIPDLDCLVFFKKEGSCIKLFDIVGQRIPEFDKLYPYIADEDDRIVEFYFFADKLDLKTSGKRPLYGCNAFVKTPFPFDYPIFPYTAKA